MAEELSTTRGLRVRPEATLMERCVMQRQQYRELWGLREGRSPDECSHLEWGDYQREHQSAQRRFQRKARGSDRSKDHYVIF